VVVVDLDHSHGQQPPPPFSGARDGLDVLTKLAAAADAPPPTDTFTVLTPSGGRHLYYRAPTGIELRNTQGRLGWRIDTRAHGVVAAVGVSRKARVSVEALPATGRRAGSSPAYVSFPRAANAARATLGGPVVMQWNPLLGAALDAADRGWHVFPLVRAGKCPALRNWEQRATTDKRQIYRWWSNAEANVGVATGRSGLVVIDLDDARGATPPERFVGARNGRDVLAMLAAEVGAQVPTDTYEVATPSGGSHLYFWSPPGLVLRNTVGSLGWKIDSRSVGGYCVAAGSVREDGVYRVVRGGAVAELPDWLARALTPAPPPPLDPPIELSARHASAYVSAIVKSETRAVAAARTGTRHRVLLKAARTLGRLVGGGELPDEAARAALLEACSGHVGIDGFTLGEMHRAIEDGVEYGKRLPRRVTRAAEKMVPPSAAVAPGVEQTGRPGRGDAEAGRSRSR
jgi:hypothetical protein